LFRAWTRTNGRKAIFQTLEIISMAENKAGVSGLSDDEAKEFHGIFSSSATVFFGVVIVAHILAWAWRPWL
jgi:light-harvesting complex 1 beta chain